MSSENDTLVDFCPFCEKETELVHIHKIEIYEIKGQKIPINADLFLCKECNQEFDNPSPDYDPVAMAFAEYRRRKGIT